MTFRASKDILHNSNINGIHINVWECDLETESWGIHTGHGYCHNQRGRKNSILAFCKALK